MTSDIRLPTRTNGPTETSQGCYRLRISDRGTARSSLWRVACSVRFEEFERELPWPLTNYFVSHDAAARFFSQLASALNVGADDTEDSNY